MSRFLQTGEFTTGLEGARGDDFPSEGEGRWKDTKTVIEVSDTLIRKTHTRVPGQPSSVTLTFRQVFTSELGLDVTRNLFT